MMSFRRCVTRYGPSHGRLSLGVIPFFRFGLCNHTLCPGSNVCESALVLLHAISGNLDGTSYMLMDPVDA